MNQITTENSTIKEIPKAGGNTKFDGTYRIRCPDCVTLYEVDASKIKSLIPEFECPECHCMFGFDYPPINPHAVLTFKIPPFDVQFKKNCPKCQHLQSEKNQICESCGVVIDNYLLIKNETYPRVSVELIKMWHKIINDFENQELHEQFIRKCINRGFADYARFKYKELSKTINEDAQCDIWLNYIDQILGEIKTKSIIPSTEIKLIKSDFVNRVLAKISHPHLRTFLSVLPLAMGTFLILFGLLSSSHRNSIGGGIALLLLTYGLTAFLRHD